MKGLTPRQMDVVRELPATPGQLRAKIFGEHYSASIVWVTVNLTNKRLRELGASRKIVYKDGKYRLEDS